MVQGRSLNPVTPPPFLAYAPANKGTHVLLKHVKMFMLDKIFKICNIPVPKCQMNMTCSFIMQVLKPVTSKNLTTLVQQRQYSSCGLTIVNIMSTYWKVIELFNDSVSYIVLLSNGHKCKTEMHHIHWNIRQLIILFDCTSSTCHDEIWLKGLVN